MDHSLPEEDAEPLATASQELQEGPQVPTIEFAVDQQPVSSDSQYIVQRCVLTNAASHLVRQMSHPGGSLDAVVVMVLLSVVTALIIEDEADALEVF